MSEATLSSGHVSTTEENLNRPSEDIKRFQFSRDSVRSSNEEPDSYKKYVACAPLFTGAFSVGIATGWLANSIKQLRSGGLNELILTDEEICATAWVYLLGAIPMCLIMGLLINSVGRKRVMMFSLFPSLIGWTCIILSTNLEILLLGRFFLGFALGAHMVSGPLYTIEISKHENRGIYGSLYSVFESAGILFSYISSEALGAKTNGVACCAVSALGLLACMFQPESPVYYLMKGKRAEAAAALQALRGNYIYLDDDLDYMNYLLFHESLYKQPLRKFLVLKSTRKGILIICGEMFLKQFSGFMPLIFFTSIFIQPSEERRDTPENITLFAGLFNLIANCFMCLFNDVIGRQYLLTRSYVFMAISTLAMSGCWWASDGVKFVQYDRVHFVITFSIYIYFFGQALGCRAIPEIIASEVFAEHYKTFMITSTSIFSISMASIATGTFIFLKTKFNIWVPLFIYFIMSVFGATFTRYLVFETSRRHLQSIQTQLSLGLYSLQDE